MASIDKLSSADRQRYYELCITKKDWEGGDLRVVLDFIRMQNAQGNVQSILEVGSGVADIVPHLPDTVRYTGLDPSEHSLRQAMGSYPQHTFVAGYAEQLPFHDGSFDLIFSYQTLQSFQDPCQALGEMARVTRPGGYIVLLAPNLECPWGNVHSVRHYSVGRKIALIVRRCMDLGMRFFGFSAFRIISDPYVQAIGRFEKPDDDLQHLTSAWEVMHFLQRKGFRDENTRKTSYPLLRFIGPLQYYGGGMRIIVRKTA